MKQKNARFLALTLLAAALAFVAAGCQSSQTPTAGSSSPAAPVPPTAVAAVPAAPLNPSGGVEPAAKTVVRIKAGAASPFTDSKGNVWAADSGFTGGETVERPDLSITNTTEPGIYRSEHYSMESFSWPLANGKFLVKLHFAETYDGIAGPGQRVFSFNVQGRDFKDFDVWVKAGGPLKAYVETIPVDITNGKLLITFTSNVENPQICGIEIIPQSD